MNEDAVTKAIPFSKLSDIHQTFSCNMWQKKVQDNFARREKCDSLHAIILTHMHGSISHIGYSIHLQKHLVQQEVVQNICLCMRSISILQPYEVFFIIHDQWTMRRPSPCFIIKNKDTNLFIKLSLYVKGMVVHGHEDEHYTVSY